MQFGLFDVIQILGAVCIFIYGLKLMSESIQRAAGFRFRKSLSNMTSNKWIGLLLGVVITGVIQSSSATSVMVISFVNAGLLTVAESVSLILGANIGTTVTSWLISLFGFKVSLSAYAVPLFAIGVPMLFIGNGRFKHWGEFIIGFAILFIGLGFLRDAVPIIDEHTYFFEWLKGFTQNGIWSRLMFVCVGIIIAIIVQSSSVALAITLTLAAQGWLPLEIAAALVLGENIGTTSTVLIASIIANKKAKTAARIHLWFNVIGVAWMVLVLPWVLPLLSSFLQFSLGINDIYNDPLDMTIGLSAFHTFFNLINALILINFTPLLVKLGSLGFSEDEDIDEIKIKFLSNVTGMPELSTIQLQKEVENFGKIVFRMDGFFKELVNSTDVKRQRKLIKKLGQFEERTDTLELEIKEYITQLMKEEMTARTSLMFRNMLTISNEMERMADLYCSLAGVWEKKMEERIYFLPEQRDEVNKLSDKLHTAYQIMMQNLSKPEFINVDKSEAVDAEMEINQLRGKIRKDHLKRLGSADYNLNSAMVYNNVFTTMERIGDHIMTITNAMVGDLYK